jgi:hypothetical protein
MMGIRLAIRGSFHGCTVELGSMDIRYVEAPFEDLQADLKSVHTSLAPPALDSSRLTNMAWMLSDDMSGTCAADLYVDNLSFY